MGDGFDKESLKAKDIIRCAGLQIQLIPKESARGCRRAVADDGDKPSACEARSQIKQTDRRTGDAATRKSVWQIQARASCAMKQGRSRAAAT